MNFFARLLVHAADQPERAALVSDALTLSYRDLLGDVSRACAYATSQGIGRDACVGVSLDDEVDHLVATLAVLATGARQITLATHDPGPIRARLCQRVGVTHVIAARASLALHRTTHVAWPGRVMSAVRDCCPADRATLYLKTSGTSGESNLVAFEDSQIGEQAERHADYAGERLLRFASVEHNNSKRHRLYCLWAGGTNVFRPRGTADVVELSLRHGVTCLDIARMHAAGLVASSRSRRMSGVKVRAGGSALPIAVRRQIEHAVTRNLYVRYAATECGGIAMACPGEHDDQESSGRPLDGVEVQIVDADGHVVPSGCSGEIRIRAPGMATGYVDSPEQSAKRFRAGWFHPGDIGQIRADGQLLVQGRADEMMIMNGLNIFPLEIERVLERHPAVAMAAALPLASRVHGQIPVAAVSLLPNASVSGRELQAFAREHLALRAPRRVLILPSLSHNSQGKLLRRELRGEFERSGAAT